MTTKKGEQPVWHPSKLTMGASQQFRHALENPGKWHPFDKAFPYCYGKSLLLKAAMFRRGLEKHRMAAQDLWPMLDNQRIQFRRGVWEDGEPHRLYIRVGEPQAGLDDLLWNVTIV